MKRALAVLLLVSVSLSALADEAAVRAMIEANRTA